MLCLENLLVLIMKTFPRLLALSSPGSMPALLPENAVPKLAFATFPQSIHLSSIYFLSHLQKAMVYRLLGNPCRAAR
ncbi:hypothetical protein HF521_022520 [Silurus meridionalis]|uniref:Uncharacterized protein n=1 Tax=Silurus meridionalis TaxID=175797 RepID=A0A8T0BC51_SILME|nr:hypothetical protein HF521_022520 [Silurus meridionalis]